MWMELLVHALISNTTYYYRDTCIKRSSDCHEVIGTRVTKIASFMVSRFYISGAALVVFVDALFS